MSPDRIRKTFCRGALQGLLRMERSSRRRTTSTYDRCRLRSCRPVLSANGVALGTTAELALDSHPPTDPFNPSPTFHSTPPSTALRKPANLDRQFPPSTSFDCPPIPSCPTLPSNERRRSRTAATRSTNPIPFPLSLLPKTIPPFLLRPLRQVTPAIRSLPMDRTHPPRRRRPVRRAHQRRLVGVDRLRKILATSVPRRTQRGVDPSRSSVVQLGNERICIEGGAVVNYLARRICWG